MGEEKIEQSFAVVSGEEGEGVPSPVAFGLRVGALLGENAEDAEGFEVCGERRGRATGKRDCVHGGISLLALGALGVGGAKEGLQPSEAEEAEVIGIAQGEHAGGPRRTAFLVAHLHTGEVEGEGAGGDAFDGQ